MIKILAITDIDLPDAVFEDIRINSDFAICGKMKDIKLPLFQNMESMVATALQAKKKDLSQGGRCQILKEVKNMVNSGWLEE